MPNKPSNTAAKKAATPAPGKKLTSVASNKSARAKPVGTVAGRAGSSRKPPLIGAKVTGGASRAAAASGKGARGASQAARTGAKGARGASKVTRASGKAASTRAAGTKAARTKAARTKAARTKAARTRAVSTKAASNKAARTRAVSTKAASTKATNPKAAGTKAAPAKAAPAKAAPAKATPAKAAGTKAAPAKAHPAKAHPAGAKPGPDARRSGAQVTRVRSGTKRAGDGHRAAFLEEQRVLLVQERASYTRQAEELMAEADSLALEHEPGDVQFDEEGGEGGTSNVDRELDLVLSAQARAAITEIDRAMVKIGTGSYGICEQCGQPIPQARLKALPYAALCVACKSGGLSRR